MKNTLLKLFSVLALVSLVLSACAPAATPTPAAPEFAGKVCQVTDVGGIDDKSFNATAWVGAQNAGKELDWEAVYLESKQQTDYEKNLTEFAASDCDLIVSVGFLLGDATKAAAEANPNQKYMILDFAYDPALSNVRGQVYAIDQAAFLAGYVAAAATKTGKVGTFGGINIPPVVDFMIGYEMGIKYYNEKHGTEVELLGWSTEANDGLFTGNFDSTDDGKRLGETLMDEGADVILPVAGPVGLGTAAAVKERGGAWIIGVDTDWTVSASEYSDIILTSILKRLDVTVVDSAKAVSAGTFEGGTNVATLATDGVGIAAINDAAEVADTLAAELEEIKAGIIDGSIATRP